MSINFSEEKERPLIRNNIDELELMLEDMEKQNSLYRPTLNWKRKLRKAIPYFKKIDLNVFRQKYHKGITAFGVSPMNLIEPRNLILRKISKGILFTHQLLTKSRVRIDVSLRKLELMRHRVVYALLSEIEPRIKEIEVSVLGKPHDRFTIEGKNYTFNFFKKFYQYLYIRNFFNFDRKDLVILELGPGVPLQIEILLKLYPEIKFVIADIPPSLYVAQQYLDAIFPGRVFPYSKARQLKELTWDIFQDLNIICIGPWQIEKLRIPINLFWDSACLQVTEPEVMRNYINLLKNIITEIIYLHELENGHSADVKTPITFSDYESVLDSIGFELLNKTSLATNKDGYFDAVWKKK